MSTYRQLTRGRLLLFLAFLVGVPAGMLAGLGYEVAVAEDRLRVVTYGGAGAALGVLVVTVAGVGRARRFGGVDSRLAAALIAAVAVAGTLRSHLPGWLTTFADGSVAGFFLAFDVVLVRLWRTDAAVRERIGYAVRRTGP
jgi:hypothetical protein